MESLSTKKANVKSDFQLGTYRSIHSLGYKKKESGVANAIPKTSRI